MTLSNCWDVLKLFLIPVGGGIPSGVLLARSHGIIWPVMAVLYFISDVILACAFEPLMLMVIAAGKKSAFFARLGHAFRIMTQRSIARYGTGLGPLALIGVAFGVDPMTGRAAAAAAGHGFVTGWAIAIAGDMLYFGVLMASTLWLNGVLGDETRTTLIILAAMLVVPAIVRRVREARRNRAKALNSLNPESP